MYNIYIMFVNKRKLSLFYFLLFDQKWMVCEDFIDHSNPYLRLVRLSEGGSMTFLSRTHLPFTYFSQGISREPNNRCLAMTSIHQPKDGFLARPLDAPKLDSTYPLENRGLGLSRVQGQCQGWCWKMFTRDGSLITCGEGVEDILIYLMEFSSPSQIYVYILFPTPGLQKKLHSPSLEMLFIFHPPPSECAEFWYPLPDVFHPPWKN